MYLQGSVRCQVCGEFHSNPQIRYLYSNKLKGIVIICPTTGEEWFYTDYAMPGAVIGEPPKENTGPREKSSRWKNWGWTG